MDVASIASALIAARMGEIQLAVAARLARMNADSQASIAKLLDAAAQNGQQLANVAAGLGDNVDIRV
jgi:hypothetical protein